MIDPTYDNHARPRIALAHDWLCGFRGGEAVLERIAMLAAELGEVDALYTMFDDGAKISPAVDGVEHEQSFLSGMGRARRWLLPAYPPAVASLSHKLARRHAARPIDLLISSSSAAIKGMRAPAGVPHLCYCHAPARYVWSVRRESSLGAGPAAALRRLGLAAYGPVYRWWDRGSASRVTHFVANSSHIAREIGRCFGREAEVVHPPVRTDYFSLDPAVGREQFWLFVGALEPYKRADLAIEAARVAGVPLKIVGEGSMGAELRHSARGAEIEFTGRVEEGELRDLYRRARLLLFPQVEDFGIVAVEALACGCPVVARRAGGALDFVDDGATGSLFDEVSARAIVGAAERCPADAGVCRKSAERFASEGFDAKMRAQITRLLR